jgi:plastocyanin
VEIVMTKQPLLAAGLLGFVVSLASASEHVVVQKDKKFSEADLTIRSKDTIVFKNDDPVVHNIFSNSDVLTFNATQDPGEETKVTADTKGTFLVRCAIHPKMKLTVRVE